MGWRVGSGRVEVRRARFPKQTSRVIGRQVSRLGVIRKTGVLGTSRESTCRVVFRTTRTCLSCPGALLRCIFYDKSVTFEKRRARMTSAADPILVPYGQLVMRLQ